MIYTSYSIREDDVTVDEWTAFEGQFGLPTLTADQLTALDFDWSDVTQITIGENDITRKQNEFRAAEEITTETRVEYFKTVTEANGYSWYEFLGVVETRGGFVEVRDSNWNTIARIADASSLQTLDDIDAEYSGFADAWNSVSAYLPASLSGENVGFTSDDWHIYAFASGELVSTINHWGGEHFWTGWDGTEYKNIDKGFHFHDQIGIRLRILEAMSVIVWMIMVERCLSKPARTVVSPLTTLQHLQRRFRK